MARITDEMINKIAGSPNKYSVLRLFKDNPYMMDNCHGLSLWVGKPVDMLGRELEEMVDMGLLKRWGSGLGAIYAYTRDEEMRRSVDDQWTNITERANELGSRKPGRSIPGTGSAGFSEEGV